MRPLTIKLDKNESVTFLLSNLTQDLSGLIKWQMSCKRSKVPYAVKIIRRLMKNPTHNYFSILYYNAEV
jgi:hypothetical protein